MNKLSYEYEWWSPDPRYQLPPRSTLARLKPIGLDTAYVEDLTSYFFRLADIHSFSPKSLAKNIIWRETRKNPTSGSGYGYTVWNKPSFNGIGKVPFTWTKLMTYFTKADNLDQLTFSSLNSFLPSKRLMSRKKRWCPLCYDEYNISHQLYSQLIWDVETISTCPKHGIKLVKI